jgi:hypothetical protein
MAVPSGFAADPIVDLRVAYIGDSIRGSTHIICRNLNTSLDLP